MPIKVISHQSTCVNLKRLLEEKGYSPADIKEKLQLETVQSVYRWYATAIGKGDSMPSVDNMMILSCII